MVPVVHFLGHADIVNLAADQENRNPRKENQNMTTARTMAAALCLVMRAALALAGEPAAKPADAKVRIGVYDSRAIVVAFFGSEVFKAFDGKELADKKAEYDKAKAEGNQTRVAELEAWGKALQIRLHKQGFSTAPVDDILKHIKDKMPEIAKSAGVGPIVSKWDKETLAKYESAERVDITMALVDAFRPTEGQRKAAIDIQKKTPISLKEAENIND